MPVRRGAAGLAAAIAVVVAGLLGAPAAAHTDLVSMNPADGSQLEQAPRRLTLEFSEEMNAALSTVTLQVDGGDPTTLDVANGRSPSTLVAAVPASMLAEPGSGSRWRAAFRVVSADGHPVAGESSFTVHPADAFDEGVVKTEGAAETSAPPGEGRDAPSAPVSERDEDQDAVSGVPLGVAGLVLALLLLSVLATMRVLRRDQDA